jgi:hypothetical protein
MSPDDSVIRVVLQRHEWDCTIACLAMLLGVDYESALVACATIKPACCEGLYLYEIQAAAEELDAPLKLRRARRFNLDEDTGILHVFNLKSATYHVVILWRGTIIETDGTLWDDSSTYFASKGYRPGALLVRE